MSKQSLSMGRKPPFIRRHFQQTRLNFGGALPRTTWGEWVEKRTATMEKKNNETLQVGGAISNIQLQDQGYLQQDRSDWLLDSAVGRWLASRQFVISNVTLLKVLLWLVLLGLFVELEFGLPFFVISLFYWLYEGLRSPAPREPGELSAYSVFNPNCQPLLGTLTAEQLEGEMGYKPLASR
ncbi:SAYSvFN domain-containing protein 1 isoform X1 [Mastacembelus armatus]|uniref:SAYSvFN domain-containing protein 1 isoform X1 n=1 Tax=Mastacembelus armatus TaxID=205130 RepID=UPI000E45BE21|nr:SAYSvFN domain-containing protein 1 isoform X1 [Mastacembelus armatus]